MRSVTSALMACETLCWVWRITLSDETIMGFTDHDRSFVFEGIDCVPAAGLDPQAASDDMVGILTSDRITDADVEAGRYDGAQVEILRVNWTDPSQFVAIASGYLGEIRRKGARFEAEWAGLASRLERSTGRVFSRTCDADFGDTRCGVDAAGFPEGTVCPRTFSACKNKFDNSQNFRGFPYILGDDALVAAPKEGEVRDGGSRYV